MYRVPAFAQGPAPSGAGMPQSQSGLSSDSVFMRHESISTPKFSSIRAQIKETPPGHMADALHDVGVDDSRLIEHAHHKNRANANDRTPELSKKIVIVLTSLIAAAASTIGIAWRISESKMKKAALKSQSSINHIRPVPLGVH